MDDMKVSLSVPATIYSFGETQNLTLNKYVTHAKLKVFYVGKTPDSRVFTKQFSDQLLQTLPGTPVVAYYSDERDDFIGHFPVQHVFGYVPETATISYVEENGIMFVVTDVLLFTGRQDAIGEIANKIIGHPHSLELDPQTVEYTIVRANNKLESLTFTKGDFIGLSVLGTKEQPAFTGSAFFAEGDIELEAFVSSFQEFKREVEFYKSGGQEMNEENNLPILENTDVAPATEDFVETVVEDVTDAQLVAVTVIVDIPEDTEVEDASLDTPAPSMIEELELQDAAKIPPTDEESITEPMTPEEKATEEEKEKEDVTKSLVIDSSKVVEAQVLEGTEDGRKQEIQKEVGENTNASALNQAERQELNEYRKKAKLEMMESYSELGSEIKEKYSKILNDFTIDELDKELAFELVKSQRQIKSYGMRVFSVMQEPVKPETLADLVNKYKDK